MNFIELVSVYKNYPLAKKSVSIIENANCGIEQGDFVVILGSSGSGKTTLLNMISGLDLPTSGSIFIGGEDISKLGKKELDEWRRKNIGIVFQNYNLMPYMSVLDNVVLPLVFDGAPKKYRLSKAKMLLKSVGLTERIYQFAHLLSGGEQQRVTIARALINDPPILIADEPTGDLDIANATEIMDLILNLHKDQKTTVLMSTHNPNYCVKYADKIIYIQDSKVLIQRNDK